MSDLDIVTAGAAVYIGATAFYFFARTQQYVERTRWVDARRDKTTADSFAEQNLALIRNRNFLANIFLLLATVLFALSILSNLIYLVTRIACFNWIGLGFVLALATLLIAAGSYVGWRNLHNP
jgi:uncharacterized membrane protein YcjF (UPF0283 family)